MNQIRSVTGTVTSCKKSFQYVPTTHDICVVSMVTALTSEYCSRTIPSIDMTTDWAFLTGIKRRHCPETNTINLTGLFKPSQPIPISPGTTDILKNNVPIIFAMAEENGRDVLRIIFSDSMLKLENDEMIDEYKKQWNGTK